MRLYKSKTANINYLAKIVNITSYEEHPNADALKCARIDGYTIVVGKDDPPGEYIYFPTGCTINPNLLTFANLYRNTEKNSDPTAKAGFFEDNGRVRAIKLRGVVSYGFLMHVEILQRFIEGSVNIELDLSSSTDIEFDSVEHNNKEIWICKKYIIPTKIPSKHYGTSKYQKVLKNLNQIIDTQFRFHYETVQAQKEPWVVRPEDLISCTYKIHGTSFISARVLCNKRASFRDKLISFLSGNGWIKYNVDYDNIYSSRKVIQNPEYNPRKGTGFYECNVYGEANKIVAPHLPNGYTAYCEIIGFTPTGNYIQKGYDYGCVPPKEDEEYTHEKHFKVRVYRITETNIDGVVHEFSAREVQQWCIANGLVPVTECYYGYAKDLYPELMQDLNNWNRQFWDKLANDVRFYMEKDSPDCVNKVPHEGLVIKREDMVSRAWKLKTFRFLNKEMQALDAGESNIEDEN